MSLSDTERSRERLVADLKAALAHAEEFVTASATQSGERLAEARSRVAAALADARGRLEDAEAAAIRTAREAAAGTERSIRDHPWTAVGVSAGIGLVLGLLIGRR